MQLILSSPLPARDIVVGKGKRRDKKKKKKEKGKGKKKKKGKKNRNTARTRAIRRVAVVVSMNETRAGYADSHGRAHT